MTPHYSVLLPEILNFAKLIPGVDDPGAEKIILVDGTLGDAGHSTALAQLHPGALILGLDQDPEMLGRAQTFIELKNIPHKRISAQKEEINSLKEFSGIAGMLCPFGKLAGLLKSAGMEAHFILLDLGVSQHHFLTAGRGFSFQDDSLDMRMDPELPVDAAEILNTFEAETLEGIFRELGEERFAGRIARLIVKHRPIQSSRQLATIVRQALPGRPSSQDRPRTSIHPATRIFQALRIYVNRELEELDTALEGLPGCLTAGGLLAVISFHSLEDRRVKQTFQRIGEKEKKKSPEKAYRIRPESGLEFTILTPHPLTASDREIYENPASRSAKLRVLQKKHRK